MDYKLLKDSVPLETAFAIYQVQLLLARGKITQVQHDEIISGFAEIIEKFLPAVDNLDTSLYMIQSH